MRGSNSFYRVALFGGTFDPLTEAHVEIAKTVLNKDIADEFWFSPTITNWYRGEEAWLSDSERLALCEDAVERLRSLYGYNARCNDRDVKLKGLYEAGGEKLDRWFFINTLRSFLRMKKETDGRNIEIVTVIGSDQLGFFRNWHGYDEILKLSKLVCVNGRNGDIVKSDVPHADILIPDGFSYVSATKIRHKFSAMKNGFDEYKKFFLSKI